MVEVTIWKERTRGIQNRVKMRRMMLVWFLGGVNMNDLGGVNRSVLVAEEIPLGCSRRATTMPRGSDSAIGQLYLRFMMHIRGPYFTDSLGPADNLLNHESFEGAS